MDHHDDWTHLPPEPGPHEPDPGHDALDGHDGLGHDGVGGHDPLDALGGYDTDPYGGHDDALAGYGDHVDPPDLRHDADLGDLPSHDPADPQPSMMDSAGSGGPAPEEHLFGVDHDLPPGEADAYFPPPVDLPDRPEPVDGYPWSDPATLVDAGTGWPEPADVPPAGAPPVGDLLSYAGMEPPADGGDGWTALVDSDDPAVSALARWWGPVS